MKTPYKILFLSLLLPACESSDKEESPNETPEFTGFEITPSEDVRTSSELLCKATAVDANDDIVRLTHTWTNGSGTVLGEDIFLTLTPETSAPGDEITCTVQATDERSDAIEDSLTVVVNNTDPIIDGITIVPAEGVLADSILTCEASATDADSEDISWGYVWDVDGTEVGTGNSLTMTHDSVDPGNVITCTATATDASGGTDVDTASVTVGNTAPVIDSVIVTPDTGVVADTLLNCDHVVTDADDDTLAFSFAWTDGSGSSLGEEASLQLAPENAAVGDQITCTVTADDGSAMVAGSDSVVVENTSPVVSLDASIVSDPSAITGSTVTCAAAFEDLNDGSLTPTYEWVNAAGDTVGTLSSYLISATETEPGESVTCTASAADAQGLSISSSASVVIENTAPTAPSVSLTADSIFVGSSDLLCSVDVESTDIDEQTLSYVFEWFDPNGNSVQTSGPTTSLSDTFSAGATSYGDWWCTVHADDGIDTGAVGSSMISLDYAVNALVEGDLVLTEIMQNPSAVSDSNGEWIEVYNATSEAINLEGMIIADTQAFTVIDEVVVVGPAEYAVLSNNADFSTNGGVAVDFEYNTVQLNNSGEQYLSIENSTGSIDMVWWDDGLTMPDPNGSSMNLSSDIIDALENDNGNYWCEATTQMVSGDYGTPGLANDTCDTDNDGYYFAEDCDDLDDTSTIKSEDMDCDGVLSVDDCDDNDASTVNDMDCDGVLSVDDCDDNDAGTVNDMDCDGVLSVDDCDDNDAGTVNDMDCDGVLSIDDCDDNDASTVNDMDCDGVSSIDDCDDNDAGTVNDMDCDGSLSIDDCDDNDAYTFPGAAYIESSIIWDDWETYQGWETDTNGACESYCQNPCPQFGQIQDTGVECNACEDDDFNQCFPNANGYYNDAEWVAYMDVVLTECKTDWDGDGYGDSNPTGIDVVAGTDCEDSSSSINPGATEIDGDGIDSDCDGNDSVPVESVCPPGKIADCNGTCYMASWLGDSFCDAGESHPANYNCEELNWDEGDCIP
jgi:hypothetical protein